MSVALLSHFHASKAENKAEDVEDKLIYFSHQYFAEPLHVAIELTLIYTTDSFAGYQRIGASTFIIHCCERRSIENGIWPSLWHLPKKRINIPPSPITLFIPLTQM